MLLKSSSTEKWWMLCECLHTRGGLIFWNWFLIQTKDWHIFSQAPHHISNRCLQNPVAIVAMETQSVCVMNSEGTLNGMGEDILWILCFAFEWYQKLILISFNKTKDHWRVCSYFVDLSVNQFIETLNSVVSWFLHGHKAVPINWMNASVFRMIQKKSNKLKKYAQQLLFQKSKVIFWLGRFLLGVTPF